MRVTKILLAASLGTTVLAGCGRDVEVPEPQSRPVKVFAVEGPGSEAVRNFPGYPPLTFP